MASSAPPARREGCASIRRRTYGACRRCSVIWRTGSQPLRRQRSRAEPRSSPRTPRSRPRMFAPSSQTRSTALTNRRRRRSSTGSSPSATVEAALSGRHPPVPPRARRALGARGGVGCPGALRVERLARSSARPRARLGPRRRADRDARVLAGGAARARAHRVRARAPRARLAHRLLRRQHAARNARGRREAPGATSDCPLSRDLRADPGIAATIPRSRASLPRGARRRWSSGRRRRRARRAELCPATPSPRPSESRISLAPSHEYAAR